MMIYIDTNILISFLNSNDIFYSDCNLIFQQHSLQFCSGFITLVEFRSSIRRLLDEDLIIFEKEVEILLKDFSKKDQIDILTKYIIEKIPLKIITVSEIEKIQIHNHDFETENGLILAYSWAKEFKLRTLDLIQIASAIKIKLYSKTKIDYFLSNDKNILRNAEIIMQKTKLQPSSTQNLIQNLEILK